ncbi:putative capsular polysaccharide synthesis family protein, partial [Vibrio rotiferianus]
HRRQLLQKRDNLKIITLVRDPVATVLSRFFQDLHIQFIEGKKNESIHKDMNETYLHLEHCFDNHINKSYFSNWFDNELKRNFNIDIFTEETDCSQPSFRFTHNNRDVLLVKCESLSNLNNELSDFLQIEDFELKNSNEAKNKWYSNIYAYFKKRYDFSKLFYMYDLP